MVSWSYNRALMRFTYATRDLQHVGNEFGTNRRTRLVLLVLASIRKVGDDGSDATSRSSPASMDHDEQFHEPVVDVSGGSRLKDEDIFISDRFSNGHTSLLI